jgi:hypothetical protein
MNPKQKADELVAIFLLVEQESSEMFNPHINYFLAVRCSIVSVNEIIRLSKRSDLFLMMTKRQLLTGFEPTQEYMEYWAKVKKELEKLCV